MKIINKAWEVYGMSNDKIKTPDVLIVSQHFPPDKSGNSSRIYDISNNLSKKNVNLFVMAPYPSFPHGTFRRRFKPRNANMINPKLKVINLASWQPRKENPSFISRTLYYITFPLHAVIWAIIYSKSYSVILTSSPPLFTVIPGLVLKLFLKKKWIIDYRDMWIEASISLGFLKKGSLTEKISKKFLKICFNKVDVVLVTTEGIKKKLKAHGVDKPIKIIPNGVDKDIFYPRTVTKKDQVIYSGNIGHAQDLENCILAMEELGKKHGYNLLIVGDGDKRTDLEELTRSRDLTEYVEFRGPVPREEIPTLISESIVGLAPLKNLESLDYAVPSKIYEYMACKIPFLGCGTGEIESLAERSEAGIVADNHPDAIAETMIKLVKKGEKMGKNGLNHVNQCYQREKIVEDLKNVLDSI